MQVKDAMTSQVVSIGPEETVSVAARALSRNNIGSLPVCTADGRLRGVVTDRDIVLRSVASNEDARAAAGARNHVETARHHLTGGSAEHAAQLMAKEQVRRLPVTKSGKLVGMISIQDLLKAPGMTMEAAKALESVSSNIRKTE